MPMPPEPPDLRPCVKYRKVLGYEPLQSLVPTAPMPKSASAHAPWVTCYCNQITCSWGYKALFRRIKFLFWQITGKALLEA